MKQKLTSPLIIASSVCVVALIGIVSVLLMNMAHDTLFEAGAQESEQTQSKNTTTTAAPDDKIIDTLLEEDFIEIDNTRKDFWFEFVQRGQRPHPIPKDSVDVLAQYNGFWIGEEDKVLYLTFNNGYEVAPNSTDVLNILKEKQVPAAFFVTGDYLMSNPELIQRMLSEGHIVGNHSMHHLNPNEALAKSLQTYVDDIQQLSKAYLELTGEQMTYVRPSSAVYSDRAIAVNDALGYKTAMFSYAYQDWDTSNPVPNDVAMNMLVSATHPGEILMLHIVTRSNVEVLADYIDYVRSLGYTFKSLDELDN